MARNKIMFVVTGGGSGIGKMLALQLASKGESVTIIGRRAHLLEETASVSSLISYLCADVSIPQGRQLVADSLSKKPLKGLVNNAGTIEPIVSLSAMDEQCWQTVMAVNLNAPLFLTQLLLPNLAQGRVLNIGSGAAYFPVVGWGAYCTSKAALSMLTRSWQLECKEVAFGYVMPGIIDTPMQSLIRQSPLMAPEKTKFFIDLKQNNKLLTAETVAHFLSWLLLKTSNELFAEKEWDIYDQSHHAHWLYAPHVVPHWESN